MQREDERIIQKTDNFIQKTFRIPRKQGGKIHGILKIAITWRTALPGMVGTYGLSWSLIFQEASQDLSH